MNNTQTDLIKSQLIKVIEQEEDLAFLQSFQHLWCSTRNLRNASFDEKKKAIQLFAQAISSEKEINELEITDFLNNPNNSSTEIEEALATELSDSVNKGYLTLEESKKIFDMWRKHVM